MPLYDLKCTKCNTIYTNITLSVEKYEKAKCPHCGGKMKSNTFSTSTPIFKGSGWTPVMTGPERKRTRSQVLGEAKHEWKKVEKQREHDKERERERVKNYDMGRLA